MRHQKWISYSGGDVCVSVFAAGYSSVNTQSKKFSELSQLISENSVRLYLRHY